MSAMSGTLTSTGWTDWAAVRELVGADDCLWVDLTGAHRGPIPAAVPVASHLWSWRPGRWVRVRTDADRALATVLTDGQRAGGRLVTARRATGIPWRRHDRAARWDGPVELVTVEGGPAITFVAIADA